jgi:hypothetical protein
MAEIAKILQLRWRDPWPAGFVAATLAFLDGAGPLAAVQAEVPSPWPVSEHKFPWTFDSDAIGELDDLDQRLLELAYGLGDGADLPQVLMALAYRPSGLAQAATWLVDQGMDDATLIGHLVRTRPRFWGDRALEPAQIDPMCNPAARPGPLGQLLQRYLPTHLPAILATAQPDEDLYVGLAWLLVMRDPPEIDLAWELVGRDPTRAGLYAPMLLAADPGRFTAWARAVAHPDHPSLAMARALALRTLVNRDSAAHIDLAVLAAQHPVLDPPDHPFMLQQMGLSLVFRDDPAEGDRLVVAAACGPPSYYSWVAVKFMETAEASRARPLLLEVLRRGRDPHVVRTACTALLAISGPAQIPDVVGLLDHRNKLVREPAGQWLLTHDPQVVEHVTPLLTARRIATRMAAARVLQQAAARVAP